MVQRCADAKTLAETRAGLLVGAVDNAIGEDWGSWPFWGLHYSNGGINYNKYCCRHGSWHLVGIGIGRHILDHGLGRGVRRLPTAAPTKPLPSISSDRRLVIRGASGDCES